MMAAELEQMLTQQLGRGLPAGITAEVDIYFKAQSEFGEWRVNTSQDALALQVKCDDGSKVLGLLPKAIDNDSQFASGGGFVRHPNEAVETFIAALRQLIDRHYVSGEGNLSRANVLQDFDQAPRSLGLLMRLTDSDNIICPVYERLCRIDEDGREWGQISYALKTDEDWRNRIEVEWKRVA